MNAASPNFRRASFTLLILGLFLHLIDFYWYDWFGSRAYFDAHEIELFRAQWRKEDSLQFVHNFPKTHLALNRASQSELEESGLPAALARRLIKFRKAFGPLKSIDELKQIYGMDSLWLTVMKDSLDFSEGFRRPDVEESAPLSLDTFNPNKVSTVELEAMGLPPSVVRGIISFREKYRPFEKPGDIYKVYTIDTVLGILMEPFIKMDSVFQPKLLAPVDLNSADTHLLKELPGFGSRTSQDFVDYRQRLGGFHQEEQLQELYFIDSSWIAQNKNRIHVKDSLRLLNINKATVESLALHPYISYSLARNLVEFRERVGLFNSVSELVNIELVDDVLFRKLAPYLRISEIDSSASLSKEH